MRSNLKAVFTLHFLNDGIRTTFVALLPFIAKELDLSLTQVGFLGASQGFMGVVLAIPTGIIAAKIGGMRLLYIALATYTFCSFLIGISPNFILLSIAFYLAAVGFAPFHNIGQSLTARASTKENIGRNLGNFTSIGESGRVLFPAAALFAAAAIGWRMTSLWIAILCVVSLIIMVWLRQLHKKNQEEDIVKKKTESVKEWLGHFARLVKDQKLLLVSAAGVFDFLGSHAIYIFIPFLLIAKGITVGILGLYMGTFFTGSLVGKSVLGRAVDTFGNIHIFYFAEILMACLLILLTVVNQTFIILLILFCLGIFTRGTTPVISSLYSEVSHEKHYEKVFAVSEIFLAGASAISPVLLGFFADVYGIQTAFYVAAVLALGAMFPIKIYSKLRN